MSDNAKFPLTDKTDLKAWLKKACVAIYVATDEASAEDISDGLSKAAARIAELEAERNGLKAALAQIAECKGTTLRGPFASGDAGRWHEVGASKAFDQCAALARAALSEPSGETA